MKAFLLSIFLSFLLLQANAQDFQYEYALEKVDTSGYFKITLPSSLVSGLNQRKSDLRIFDQENIEIPYLLELVGFNDSLKHHSKVNGYTTTYKTNTKKKTTEIEVVFHTPQRFSMIEFQIEAPLHYKRTLILKYQDYPNLTKKASKSGRNIEYFTISSDHEPVFGFSEVKTERFLVFIENQDNPPLSISNIHVFQRNHQLIAYLEKGKSYLIKYGNEELKHPQYDLAYFKSNLPRKLPAISLHSPVTKSTDSPEIKRAFYENAVFLWGILLLVIIFLSILSFKMVGDLDKKKKKS